jgi:hypothetical protein
MSPRSSHILSIAAWMCGAEDEARHGERVAGGSRAAAGGLGEVQAPEGRHADGTADCRAVVLTPPRRPEGGR